MANDVLAKLAVKIAADTAEFKGALANTQKELKSFQTNLAGIATSVGIAFGVREVAQFVFEVSQLAGEAEAVRNAFDKLPNSTRLMMDLKDATHGTVSELDLMKRTVQATNFGISLEAMPKLLEFAAIRAQQTGQSVDYLVDSIVTGIGRKSPLILDNLGISAVALRDKMDGVALATASVGDVANAVGQIAGEELLKMGDFSENAKSKVERLSASWVNFKIAIGDAANGTGFLGSAIDAASSSLDVAASKHLSFWEKIKGLAGGAFGIANAQIENYRREVQQANEEQAKQEQIIREVDIAFATFGKNIDAYGKSIENHVNKTALLAEYTKRLVPVQTEQVTTIDTLKAKLSELNTEYEATDVNNQKRLASIGNEIIQTQNLISTLEEYRKKQEQLQTQFAKDQLANAQAGKQTTVTDPTTPAATPTNPFNQTIAVDDPLIQEREGIIRTQEQWQEYYALKREMAAEDQARMQEQANAAMEYGNAIGDSLAGAISGQQTFSQAMKKLTGELIRMFLQRALAGIISSAATSGGPPPVAIALAAAGVAAISAMFSRIGGGGGGGGGGSASVKPKVQSAGSNDVWQSERSIEVNGRFELSGDKLVAVAERTNNKNGRTFGG